MLFSLFLSKFQFQFINSNQISTTTAPSNDLKAATVPLIAQEICRQSRFYGDEILDTMFCAGYLNKTGIDACDGDSGGPLVCADELGMKHLTR